MGADAIQWQAKLDRGGFFCHQSDIYFFFPRYCSGVRPERSDWESGFKECCLETRKLMNYSWVPLEVLERGTVSVRNPASGNRPSGVKEKLIIPQDVRAAIYKLLGGEKELTPLGAIKPILKKK